jgi:stage V sporulation protein AA
MTPRDKCFDVYLQFDQNIAVEKQTVRLADIADILCSDSGETAAIGDLVVAVFKKGEQNRVLSAVDVVRAVVSHAPGSNVTILGENEFVLTRIPKKEASPTVSAFRTTLVCLISFFGAAFSVASFNNDVDVSLLFDQILKTTKNTSDLLPWLQISYSVGIPTGILVFYNHISRKKMYNDPTPLEVEMRLYEQEENTAVILNQHRKEEHDVSK